MNWANALCKRAIWPCITAKREPVNFTALSKSRPNGVAKSTWSLTGKSKLGILPQRKTSWLADSSLPDGTDSWGILGIFNKKWFSCDWTTVSFSVSACNSWLTAVDSAISALASSPLPFFMPTALANWLRLACNSSERLWTCLRSDSKETKVSLSRINFRSAKRAATVSRSLRNSWISIMSFSMLFLYWLLIWYLVRHLVFTEHSKHLRQQAVKI